MEMKRTELKRMAEQGGDKLIFTTKVFSASRNIRVGISKDSAAIVNDICLQTGLTASEVVNRMIAFSSSHVEILPGFFFGEDEEKGEG